MDVESIRLLLAVIDEGTIQGAASSLGTSRATVRRRLQELEDAVGVLLIDRGQQGIQPTEAGRLLAERGRLLVEQASVLLEEVRSAASSSIRVLRLMWPDGVPTHLVARVAAEFLRANSDYRFDLRQSADPLSELMDDTDVAIVFNEGKRPGPWRTLRLASTPERLLARPDILAEQPVRTVSDLGKHRLLVWRSPEYPTDQLPLREGGTLAIRPHLVTSDIHFLHATALAGGGIAFVPDGGLDYEFASADSLTRVLPDQVGRDRFLSVIMAESLMTHPKVQAVGDMLQQFVRIVQRAPSDR